MAAVELRAGANFDADAFATFLRAQRDLGTKWAPTYVRVTDALPITGTGKLDRRTLRGDRWQTADPVWWRRGRALEYVLLTSDDVATIEDAFQAAGRAHLLRG